MDEYRLWQDDYRREVEEVLAAMRRGDGPAYATAAANPAQAIPSAGSMRELSDARSELEKLGQTVDELRRQLAAREAELAREARRRGRFKELAVRLDTAVRRLDEELNAARRRSREQGLRAKDLAVRLRGAMQERRRSAAGLSGEQRKILEWASDARALQGRINELELGVEAKTQALSALQTRAAAAARAYEERAASREAVISELTAKLERERAERARVQERLDSQQSISVQAVRGAETEAARLQGERDAVFRRLDQTMAEISAERSAREHADAERVALATELAKARNELSQLKAADAAEIAAQVQREIAAERRELHELWEAERRAGAERLEHAARKEKERRRIEEESRAALEKAARVLSGEFTLVSRPAPAPSRNAPEAEGLWSRLRKLWRGDDGKS